MKKLIIGVGVICLFALMVFAASSNTLRQSINKEYSNCMKDCTADKKENFAICKADFNNNSAICKTEFKACFNSTNETAARRNCSTSYTECKKIVTSTKTSCLKNQTNGFMACKSECKATKDNCIAIYEPVCGTDGITYPNICTLNIANVSKAYDGRCNETYNVTCSKKKDCPDLLCIKHPCPSYDCIGGVCVIKED